jgi:uncharacterized protein (AIM24 family)
MEAAMQMPLAVKILWLKSAGVTMDSKEMALCVWMLTRAPLTTARAQAVTKSSVFVLIWVVEGATAHALKAPETIHSIVMAPAAKQSIDVQESLVMVLTRTLVVKMAFATLTR